MSEQNSKIAEMLDHLVNDDTAKAEELFHEYVVEKSRDIYEGLIEDEVEEATEDDDEAVEEASEDEDEAVDEASDNDDDDAVEESADADDEEVEEGFDEVELEGDDEEGDATDMFAKDAEDGEEGEEDDMEGGDEPATKDDVMDLKSAIDELEDAFKAYAEGEDEGDMEPEMDDMEAIQQPEFESEEGAEDLETVREYANDVKDGHGAEKKGKAETADNKASPVAKPNNMGGTTANMTKGGEGGGSETGLTGKPKDMNTKNINKVGGSNDGERMSTNGAGHGAEKKGAGEGSADATSIIGSK